MDTRTDTTRAGHQMLLAASAALLIAVGLHGVDHTLQDRGIGALTTEVLVGGGSTQPPRCSCSCWRCGPTRARR